MILPDYLSDVAKEMRLRSAGIRRDFATHRPTAGSNREHLVKVFLEEHLPKRYTIDTGLLITPSGQFSNQADLLVLDGLGNAPLHASQPHRLWPVEAAYALLEVKTNLSPDDIADSVAKCRRFKKLERSFLLTREPQPHTSSLFVLWAYDSPSVTTAAANLREAFKGVPRAEQPDLVIVPDRFVAKAGEYLEISNLGQPGSPHRAALQAKHGADLSALVPEAGEVLDFGDNSLLAWFVWFDSWLRHAGSRLCDPVRYVPPDMQGKRV